MLILELKGQVGVYTTLAPKEQKPFELERELSYLQLNHVVLLWI